MEEGQTQFISFLKFIYDLHLSSKFPYMSETF